MYTIYVIDRDGEMSDVASEHIGYSNAIQKLKRLTIGEYDSLAPNRIRYVLVYRPTSEEINGRS